MTNTMNRRPGCGCNSSMDDSYTMNSGGYTANVPAMCFVPWQNINRLFEPEQALEHGTAFPELVKPFLGKRGCRS